MAEQQPLPYRADWVDPTTLKPHPTNWAYHSEKQRAALAESVSIAGVIDEPIVNETTGHILDGHLRVEEAIRRGERQVYVKFVVLTEQQERRFLLLHDRVAELRERNEERLGDLLLMAKDSDGEIPEAFQGDREIAGLLEEARKRRDGETGGGTVGGTEPTDALDEPFAVVPTTALDARSEFWLARRRAWVEFGLGPEEEPGADPTRPGFYASKRAWIEANPGADPDDFLDVWKESQADRPAPVFFDPVLAEACIRWWCPEGGRVLDLFDGGSVRGVVAGKLGALYIGLAKASDIPRRQSVAASLEVGGCAWLACRPDDAAYDLPAPDRDAGFDMAFLVPAAEDFQAHGGGQGLSSRAGRAAIEAAGLLRDERFLVVYVEPGLDPRELVQTFANGCGLRLVNEATVILPTGPDAVEAIEAFSSSRALAVQTATLLVFWKTRDAFDEGPDWGDVQHGRPKKATP